MIVPMVFINSCNVNCLEGEGDIIKSNVETEDFDGIVVNIPATVYVIQSNEVLVEVKAQSNLFDNLVFDVDNDMLKISSKNCMVYNKSISILVKLPVLETVKLNGSGEIKSIGEIKTESLDINVNGSGDVLINTITDEVEVDVNGSGDVVLKGEANDLEIDINGSGDVKAFDLEVDNSSIHIKGSGDAKVNVNEELEVKISGSGDVQYTGEVNNVKTQIRGSGEIHKK